MIIIFKLILSALFTIYSVKWIYLKILKIAKIKDIVDNPNVRKLQKTPMPVLGGLVVFFGLLMGLMLFYALTSGEYTISSPLIIGAGVLLFFGAMDDILNLTPKSRIIIEIVTILGLIFGSGMCIDSLYGLWGINNFSWWIAVPLTVFAGVGIINAYNMMKDNFIWINEYDIPNFNDYIPEMLFSDIKISGTLSDIKMECIPLLTVILNSMHVEVLSITIKSRLPSYRNEYIPVLHTMTRNM